ncbi:MAG TPA: hypothetical protein VGE41_00170 [Verrucomicrobiae bacterium]
MIDGETANPTIYTGSANMSKNSVENNDENLLEIKGNTALAELYLAEFFRLYDHYRARALWNYAQENKNNTAGKKKADGFQLKTNRDAWAKNAYKNGTLENIGRVNLAGPLK